MRHEVGHLNHPRRSTVHEKWNLRETPEALERPLASPELSPRRDERLKDEFVFRLIRDDETEICQPSRACPHEKLGESQQNLLERALQRINPRQRPWRPRDSEYRIRPLRRRPELSDQPRDIAEKPFLDVSRNPAPWPFACADRLSVKFQAELVRQQVFPGYTFDTPAERLKILLSDGNAADDEMVSRILETTAFVEVEQDHLIEKTARPRKGTDRHQRQPS